MATQVADPRTPAGKPHGTTTDQVREMESEGQGQTQGQPDRSATSDPAGQAKGSSREVPGDTGSADIVGRTGEQMPLQSHDGLEADSREAGSHRTTANH